MSAFERLQPVVQLFYFIGILILAMFVMHPVVQILLFVGGIVCFVMLKTLGDALRFLLGILPVFLFVAVINPLFSHQGVTILGYFKSGNPLTLEAILYGIHTAFLLITTILWFFCMSMVLTSDKLIAILGKRFPTITLIFVMLLRFLPHFRSQAQKTETALEGMRILKKKDSVKSKLSNATKVFLTMMTWSLENSVDTADSMQARGYGGKRRSHYNRYIWRMQDFVIGGLLLVTIGYWSCLLIEKRLVFYIYPIYYVKPFDVRVFIGIVFLLVWMFIPLGLEIGDKIKWYNLKRKI